MYEYRCTVLRVLDGDTAEVDIDLGFRLHYRHVVRLCGINAPELRTRQGPAAKARLEALLMHQPRVRVRTTLPKEFEKYGRILGTFIVNGVEVNAAMVADGFAKEARN
jgi:micrococcal nuclease